MKRALAAFFTIMMAAPLAADGDVKVADRKTFVQLIDGRDLTRFGIKLNVSTDGKISGAAFGRDVSGDWEWDSGYFCRDLYWGSRDLGANCQAVKVQDGKIRFISDKGTGDHADFALR